jgi:hypothetical protein
VLVRLSAFIGEGALYMLGEQFDTFLFDLEGTVYIGDELLPHTRESLLRLRFYWQDNSLPD